MVAQRRVKIIEWTNRQAFEKWQEPSLTNHLQRYALAAQSVSVILYQLPYVPVSQIESTVKASMLDLKILFSGSLCQIEVCLPFENGSATGIRIGVRYSKGEH